MHSQLRDRELAREKAEASRLLYVAMTRAEHRLVLTHAERQRKSVWEKLAIDALPQAEIAAEAPPSLARKTKATAPTNKRCPHPSSLDNTTPPSRSRPSRSSKLALENTISRGYLGLEPEPVGPGTGAIELGLAVHDALAGLPVDSPEAIELAAKFKASEWGQRAARASRVEREFDFLFEIDDVILRGQIDLWFEESGELVPVDYKTDRESSAEAYALQLRLYALALERQVGRLPDRAILFYVRSENAVEISLSVADFACGRIKGE